MARAGSAGVEGEAEAGPEVSSSRLGSGAHQGCEGTARKAQEAEETQEAHRADGTERSQTGSPGLSHNHLTLSYLLVLLSLSHLLPPGRTRHSPEPCLGNSLGAGPAPLGSAHPLMSL